MNREIKFRAWDGDFGIMVYDFQDGYHLSMQNGELVVSSNDGEGDYFELPLMQFTGICDKNGFEIYEGDIVEKHDSKFCKRGEVQILEGTWMVVEDETHYFNLHFYKSQIRVLGNKFDPELLNE